MFTFNIVHKRSDKFRSFEKKQKCRLNNFYKTMVSIFLDSYLTIWFHDEIRKP